MAHRPSLTEAGITRPSQALPPPSAPVAEAKRSPARQGKKAIAFWHEPELSDATQRALASVAHAAFADAKGTQWKQQQYPVLLENALRLLVAVSPDVQTS